MSAQNRYQIASNYKDRGTWEWRGWGKSWLETADTWQDATPKWIDHFLPGADYTVVSETPSEDSKSGIIEIQFDPPQPFCLGVKIKATLIEN